MEERDRVHFHAAVGGISSSSSTCPQRRVETVQIKRAVRQHHAFGPAGAATGIEQLSHRILVVGGEVRRFARKYLASGVRLFPLLDKQSRACPETMTQVYELLLNRIEKNNYDVLNHRASLTKLQKFKLLSVIWLRRLGIRFV